MTDPVEPAAAPAPARSRRGLIALAAIAVALLIAVVVVLVLLLTRGGEPVPTVSPAPSGTSTPTSTPTPTPSATATVAPVPAAFVMPSCTQLAVPDIPPRVEAGEWVELTRDGATGEMAGAMPGPVAAAAIEASPQLRMCAWGPPNSEAAAIVWVAEMAADRWDAFAGELTASGWTAVDVDGAPGFMQVTGEAGMNGPAEWWYVHDRGAWLIFPFESAPEVRSAAVAGVRATNP